jgi:hypothetical protein
MTRTIVSKAELTQAIVFEHMEINAQGDLVWTKKSPKANIGDIVGTIRPKDGYHSVSFLGTAYSYKQLKEFALTGEWKAFPRVAKVEANSDSKSKSKPKQLELDLEPNPSPSLEQQQQVVETPHEHDHEHEHESPEFKTTPVKKTIAQQIAELEALRIELQTRSEEANTVTNPTTNTNTSTGTGTSWDDNSFWDDVYDPAVDGDLTK